MRAALIVLLVCAPVPAFAAVTRYALVVGHGGV